MPQPSCQLKRVSSPPKKPTEINMYKTIKYAIVGGLFAAVSPAVIAEDTKKCSAIYQETSQVIAKSPSQVLEIVGKMVAANEACAPEVVKAAIITTKADANLVALIVETAGNAAPKQISSIALAAYASAPDAKEQIVAAVKNVAENSKTAQNQLAKDPLGELTGGPGVEVGFPGGGFQGVQNGGTLLDASGIQLTPSGTTE